MENFVYLGRLCDADQAEKIEKILNGENIAGQFGTPMVATVRSEPKDKTALYNLSDEAKENLLKLEGDSVYFFLSDSAEYLCDYCDAFANEVDQYGEGIAQDRSAMLVLQVPCDVYDKLVASGNAQEYTGYYGEDYDQCEIDEFLVGGDAAKKLISSGMVCGYGDIKWVYHKLGARCNFDYDDSHYFTTKVNPEEFVQ